MRIAIPTISGKVSPHFGHCEKFMFFDVDGDGRTISGSESLAPPPHEPGALPEWLGQQGATLVIAGGMGGRAQQLLARKGIEVVCGVPEMDGEKVAKEYLAGNLEAGGNLCDH